MASEREPRREINPGIVEIKEKCGKECDFCHKSRIDPLRLGPMYKLRNITTHYFCLLFSSGIPQNGEDDQGILGFLEADIKKELKRGHKLKCMYCNKRNATLQCCSRRCKTNYHFSCGLKNGSLHQFIGNYESFCSKHRPEHEIAIPKSTWACPVCGDGFDKEKFPIKPPCCVNNGVFHRKCMMRVASKSGLHYFKCPLCNDKEGFCEAMRFEGIYVPDRDAEWESEPGAFADLTVKYNRCDKNPCLCPSGPDFNEEDGENEDWKVIRCGGCGAAGVHMKCEGLNLYTYRCEICAKILQGTVLDQSVDEDGSQSQRRTEHPTPGSGRIRQNLVSASENDEYDSDEYDSDESSGSSSGSSSLKSLPLTKDVHVRAYVDEVYDSDTFPEEEEDYPEETEEDFVPSCASKKDLLSVVANYCELYNIRPVTNSVNPDGKLKKLADIFSPQNLKKVYDEIMINQKRPTSTIRPFPGEMDGMPTQANIDVSNASKRGRPTSNETEDTDSDVEIVEIVDPKKSRISD